MGVVSPRCPSWPCPCPMSHVPRPISQSPIELGRSCHSNAQTNQLLPPCHCRFTATCCPLAALHLQRLATVTAGECVTSSPVQPKTLCSTLASPHCGVVSLTSFHQDSPAPGLTLLWPRTTHDASCKFLEHVSLLPLAHAAQNKPFGCCKPFQ